MENNNYKPKVLKFDVDWIAIKDACMQTIGKEAKGNEPSEEWKKKLLICKHSPIRRSLMSIKWDNIPSYVSTHYCRHSVGVTPYVQTSREDRTGVPRNERVQTEMVSMQMDMNIQALFNIMEKRLCMCSDPTTIKYAEGLLEAIKEYDENIAWSCVPSGIAHGGCTEPFSNCKMCNKILERMTPEERLDIMKRYDAYNKYREEVMTRKRVKESDVK